MASGVLVLLLRDPDPLQQLARPPAALLARHALPLDRPENDVVPDRHVWEEIERLKDHPDLRAQPAQRLARIVDRSALEAYLAGVHRLEAVDAAQQRGLSGPRGAGDHDGCATLNGQVDAVENNVVAEALAHLRELDQLPVSDPRHPIACMPAVIPIHAARS
jgi:hypothetical protein